MSDVSENHINLWY